MEIPKNCKECPNSYCISIPPLWQRYCDIVGDDVSHKTRKRHPRCPYNQIESDEGAVEELKEKDNDSSD